MFSSCNIFFLQYFLFSLISDGVYTDNNGKKYILTSLFKLIKNNDKTFSLQLYNPSNSCYLLRRAYSNDVDLSKIDYNYIYSTFNGQSDPAKPKASEKWILEVDNPLF